MTDSSRDLAGTMLQAAFIGALAAGCFWILRPFLLPMIWATAIVVATWPLMLRLQDYLGGRRGLAVTVMTLGLLLVLLVPLAFAIAAIAQNADRIVGWAKSLGTVSIPPPPDWVVRLPLVGATIATQWQQVAGLGTAGALRRHRTMVRCSSGGASTTVSAIGFGSTCRIADKVEISEGPSKARRPVTISYKTEPNEKMSERASTFPASACSGDM